MRADADTLGNGLGDHPLHRRRVAGVEPAGNACRANDLEQRHIIADVVGAKALAHIGVEIDHLGHAHPFLEPAFADACPNVAPSPTGNRSKTASRSMSPSPGDVRAADAIATMRDALQWVSGISIVGLARFSARKARTFSHASRAAGSLYSNQWPRTRMPGCNSGKLNPWWTPG